MKNNNVNKSIPGIKFIRKPINKDTRMYQDLKNINNVIRSESQWYPQHHQSNNDSPKKIE
jgi:hypothetical protein